MSMAFMSSSEETTSFCNWVDESSSRVILLFKSQVYLYVVPANSILSAKTGKETYHLLNIHLGTLASGIKTVFMKVAQNGVWQ